MNEIAKQLDYNGKVVRTVEQNGEMQRWQFAIPERHIWPMSMMKTWNMSFRKRDPMYGLILG